MITTSTSLKSKQAMALKRWYFKSQIIITELSLHSLCTSHQPPPWSLPSGTTSASRSWLSPGPLPQQEPWPIRTLSRLLSHRTQTHNGPARAWLCRSPHPQARSTWSAGMSSTMWRSLITTNIRTYSILSMTQPHRQSIGRSTFNIVHCITDMLLRPNNKLPHTSLRSLRP